MQVVVAGAVPAESPSRSSRALEDPSRSMAMELTDILSSEHRVIEQVLAALDAAADRIEAGQAVRPGFFIDAARFIRDFADGFHHGKEEGALFEAMGRNGMPMDNGPIGMMLYEHDRARELTTGLRTAAERWAAGDARMAHTVVDYARTYAQLLTQHIYKEDNILFPMAEQAIPSAQEGAILADYRRIEGEQALKGTKASWLDLARALCAEVGVDPAAAPRRTVELPCHAR
jgi:hemerythrin-like domain-containing protein